MKQLLIILSIGFSTALYGQEKINFETPPASPEASFTQQLVNGEITVRYSRPMTRRRKVFGGLVPYDSLWRTGASDATTIHITEEIIAGDKRLKEGKYTLFTIPGKDEWTIIINTDTLLHGTFGYNSSKDVHRFKVKSQKSDLFTEAFSISFNKLTKSGSGVLTLAWEYTIVEIPVKSAAEERVMTEIGTRLITNNENNAELLYQAASYYHTTGRDLVQATVWVTAAENADKENFNYPNLLQKILADQQDYKSAIVAAKRALALAQKKNMGSAVASLKKRLTDLENK